MRYILRARLVFCLSLVLMVCLGRASRASAEVTRIIITSRAPAFNGRSFGTTGAYEEIRGLAVGELDPTDPKNALITDIALAPLNARGQVEYRTTFTLVKPVDMAKSTGVLLYNIVNRGNHNGPNTWHVGGGPGDGFVYRLGQAVLWSGWQGDMPIARTAPGQEGLDVPMARNPDGSAVSGPVWARFINVAGNASTQPLPGAAGRMPATIETAEATLISATSETSAGVKGGVVPIASADWAFGVRLLKQMMADLEAGGLFSK